jgi:hypothetical protein
MTPWVSCTGSSARKRQIPWHASPKCPRSDLPNNERHRLQLHFSKNCTDWCFAGLVAAGTTERHARNYASMAIDRDDLVILCRSGDDDASDPQYTNMITFHRVRDFRNLVY